ncbi:MAG TPA: NAD(P)H-dependent oxidoreductase subunit E [Anaerolineales bacterium]|nr:NAD(P)H-dependent oxidoreductase subunit E [Anaerolineales bacterium]
MLVNKYSKEIDRILGKFPPERKRAAALPLLYLAQREYGHVSKEAIREVADILDVDPTQVGGLVGFYSLLHAKAGGKYRLQVCTDLPCALRGAEEFTEELCENLRIKIGETTEDGLITVEEVKCLAGCDKAPMFQLQAPDGIHYFENQDLESAMALIEELRQRGDDA